MTGRQFTLKVQKISSLMLFILAGVLLAFSLGFMTNFYQLFIEGNSEMYKFYKNLQMLNTLLFDSAIILVVMALLHFAFEFHKQIVGFGGVMIALTNTILAISNGIVIFQTNDYFKNEYLKINFENLTRYTPSILTFILTNVLLSSVIVISILVTIVSCINFIRNYRK